MIPKKGIVQLLLLLLLNPLFSQEIILSDEIIILSDDETILIEDSEDSIVITRDDESQESDTEQAEEPVRYIILGEGEELDPAEESKNLRVITSEEIEQEAPSDTAELLDALPGVSVLRLGGPMDGASLSLRGSSSEQTLILINGRRLNSAQGGGVDLSSIPPDQIERIEIIRGSATVAYGEGAMGGVINIVLKEDSSDSFELSLGADSFSSIKAGVSYFRNGSNNKSYILSLNIMGTQGRYLYQDPYGENKERENGEGWKIDNLGRADIPLNENLNLSGLYQFHFQERGIPGTVQFPTSQARMEDLRFLSQISLEGIFQNLKGTADISLLNQAREYSDPAYSLGAVEEQHFNTSWHWQTDLLWIYSTELYQLDLTGGYQGGTELLDSTAISTGGGTQVSGLAQRNHHSAYVSANLAIGKESQLRIQPGIRWDWSQTQPPSGLSITYQGWSKSCGMIYTPLKWLNLKGNLGTAYRMPGFNDLFWSSTAFAKGNPDLKPEISWDWDAGLLLTLPGDISLEGSYFSRQTEQLILWTPGPNGQWSPRNIGDSWTWGLEGEARGLWFHGESPFYSEWILNGTILRPVNQTDGVLQGKFLTRKPMDQASFTWVLNHEKGHSIRWENRYTGVRFITMENSKWLPWYFVSDLAVVWTWSETWRTELKLNNLFNQSYVDLREYPIPGISGSLEVTWSY